MDSTSWLIVGVVAALAWAAVVVRIVWKMGLDVPLKPSYRLFHRKGKHNGDQ